MRYRTVVALAVAGVLVEATAPAAETVAVRYREGIVHGFLSLRTLGGELIANGDLLQRASGTRVTSRLVFHFKDGSLHDEEAVFTQRGRFRLVRDHLVQRGPSFPNPLDMTIDAASGRVQVRYREDGEEKNDVEQMQLPPDLANGLILTLLKNVSPGAPPKSLAFVAATPKPRLVKLLVASAGGERFSTGTERREAVDYVLKVDIGGIKGLLAPLFGKQPPDSHVWILHGEAPAFVKSEQELYVGGPLWRIELESPTFKAP